MKTIEANTRVESERRFIDIITVPKYAISISLVVIIAMLGSLFYAGILRFSSTPSVLASNCSVSILSGTIEIQRKQSDSWTKATEGIVLQAGDKVKTAIDSQAMLTFFEGSTLTIGPQSELEIQQVSQSKEKQTVIVLKQLVGSTWSRVVHMADPGSRYEIETPSAYALVRGTKFETDVNAQGATTLQTTEGTVAVQAQGKEVLVSAGYEVEVEPGMAPGEPVLTNSIPQLQPESYREPVPTSSTPAPNPSPELSVTATVLTTPSPTPSSAENATPLPTSFATPTPTPTATADGVSGSPGDSHVPLPERMISTSVSGGNGSVIPAVQVVEQGCSIVINISPEVGYHIAGITDNLTPATVANPFVISNIIANHDVVVTFAIDTFAVNASVSGGHGSVSPGVQSIDYNTSASIDITPDAGYHIAGITDNLAPATIANPFVISKVTAPHNVVVTFAIDTFAINASVSGGHGSVSPGVQSIAYNTSASIDITPDAGYHIAGITDNLTPATIANPFVISNVTAPHNVVVTFAIDTYTITVTAGANGSISPGGPLSVNYGDTPAFTITPASGYRILDVLLDSASIGTTSSYTFGPVSANHTITASFTRTFTLTIGGGSPGFGSVTQPGEGLFTYDEGLVVNLLAAAHPNHCFVNWTGDVTSISDVNNAAATITMNSDYVIQANFAVAYLLTITSDPVGTVTQPGIGTFTYRAGTGVDLAAESLHLGQGFEKWEGDNGTIADQNNANTTITINGNYTINAKFHGVAVHLLTIITGLHGNVIQPGVGIFSYNDNTVVNLEAVPDPGYVFLNWTGDVQSLADINAAFTTITMHGNHTLMANFVPEP